MACRWLGAVAAVLAVTGGCAEVGPTAPVGSPRAVTAVPASAPPGTKAAVPSPLAVPPAPVITDGGVVFNNPHGIPATVALPLPASLIGNDGAGAVAKGGTRVAGFHVLAATPSGLAAQIRGQLATYQELSGAIDGLLKLALSGALQPGVPRTLTPDAAQPGQHVAFLLRAYPDHARIDVGRGDTVTGQQILSISFTSPRRGRAIFHPETAAGETQRGAAVVDFDLEAGVVTLDGVNSGPVRRSHTHVELRRWARAAADGPAFQVIAGDRAHDQDPGKSGVVGIVANFLTDNSAAAQVGVVNPNTGGELVFPPATPGAPASGQPEGHFMDDQGRDLPRAEASAALRAILPPHAMVPAAIPADFGPTDDLVAGPFFAFPP